MSRLIAVTGATGFVGARLCQRLLERGIPLRVLVRSRARAADLAQQGAEVVKGDLASADALAALVTGASAIVHCAGSVRGRKLADFSEANVDGVRNLVDSLLCHNPEGRLLFISSLAANFPELSHYAASKRLGEGVLRDSGFSSYAILRPPAIYGPGDRELLPLFRAMLRGFAPLPGDPGNRVSLIYVDDLVAAVEAWLDVAGGCGATYTISGPEKDGYSWAQVCEAAGAVIGRRIRPIRVPTPLLDVIAWSNQKLSRLLGYDPMLTPAKLRELRHSDWRCNSNDFARDTGWQPRVPFPEGFALTLAAAGVSPAAFTGN